MVSNPKKQMMPMKMSRSIALCFSLVLLFGCQREAKQADSPSRELKRIQLPFDTTMKWIYRVEGFVSSENVLGPIMEIDPPIPWKYIERMVEGVDTLDIYVKGIKRLNSEVEITLNQDIPPFNSSQIYVDENGYHTHGPSNEEIILVRFPLSLGDSWKYFYSIRTTIRKVVSVDSTIVVNGVTYERCVCVEESWVDEGDRFQGYYFINEDVGLISYSSGARKVNLITTTLRER